jgi:hypothetical protein
MLVSVVPVSAEYWSHNTNGGIKIIKINTNDANWQENLKITLKSRGQSNNVIIEVHGVEINPTKSEDYYSDDFNDNFAQDRGYDTVILLEYVPEGKRYFGNPWRGNSAAVWLNEANKIVKTETGNDPGLLCHSYGGVICNKQMDYAIANNEDTYWKEIQFAGSVAPLTKQNVQKWGSRTSGIVDDTTGKSFPAVFFSMRHGDVARNTQPFFDEYNPGREMLGFRYSDTGGNVFDPVGTHNSYFIGKNGEKFYKNFPKVGKSSTNQKPPVSIVGNNPDTDNKFVKTGYQYPPICPFCDDDGGNLGGVNFSNMELTSISTNFTVTPSGQYGFFDYVLRAEKEKTGTSKIDVGNSSSLAYNTFFVGLFMPNNLFWVNLNPWEPNRLLGDGLEKTDAGRTMLEADLQMKKDFAKYENPCESDVGTRFWKKLDEKSDQLEQNLKKKYPNDFSEKDIITFSTVSRNWIVPDKINAQGMGDTIYLESATLTIESEPVYDHSQYDIKDRYSFLFSQPVKDDLAAAAKEYGKYSMELQDEMIRPLVVRDINSVKEYAALRTVYHSLILAQWYKNKFQRSPALFSDEFDSGKIESYGSDTQWKPESIWQAYQKSYEEHEYECVKTEEYTRGNTIITSKKIYQSGGVDFEKIPLSITGSPSQKIQKILNDATFNYYASDEDNYYIGEPLFVYETTNEKNSASGTGLFDSILQLFLRNWKEHPIYPGQYRGS